MRLILATTTSTRVLKKAKSQSYQKRRMKNPRAMFLSIIMKKTTRKLKMTSRSLLSSTRRMKSEELRHQDDSSQPSMKIFFLYIGNLATIFGIRLKIVKFMEEMHKQ